LTLDRVLESLQDFLVEVRRIIKPGGILALRTPNNDSMFHVLARVMMRFRWYYPAHQIYHDDHLSYFSQLSIENVLSRAGFKAVNIYANDITIHDMRFQGLKKHLIRLIYILSKITKRPHSIAVLARPNTFLQKTDFEPNGTNTQKRGIS